MNKEKKQRLFNITKITTKLASLDYIWTFFVLLVAELFEELIEEGIALGFTVLIAKAVSAIFVVTITQTIKVAIKRLIKVITYKEGNDKVKLLKNYWTLVWGNKITGLTAGILGGGLVYFQNLYPQFAGVWYYALIAFVVIYNVAIIIGGETLAQILDRFAQAKLKKEDYKKIKEAEAKAKEIAKKVDEEFKKLQAENEAKLRAEAEAKVLSKLEVANENIQSNS